MSTSHWNGTKFRSAEWSTLVEDLTAEDADLREQAEAEEQKELSSEFLNMVMEVEQICKPRMHTREMDLVLRKLKALQRNLGAPVQ